VFLEISKGNLSESSQTLTSSFDLETTRYQNAFRFYQLAAEQQSALAHLKLGDFKYYGLGVPKDQTAAAQYYKIGSDLKSPQAAFNLGYMHQKGLGLPKDFHLAKRYYDLAIVIDIKEAYVPSMLGLLSLFIEGSIDYLAEDGLIYGYQWDTILLVFLCVTLGLALGFRQILIGNEHNQQLEQILNNPMAEL